MLTKTYILHCPVHYGRASCAKPLNDDLLLPDEKL